MYNSKQFGQYLRNLYEKSVVGFRNLMGFSGLEKLAVAGVPNGFFNTTTVPPMDARDYYILNSNVGEIRSDGKNVYVKRASDGKTVPLHPASVKKSSEGYVKQVLGNNGMHPNSAVVEKIAKLVEQLRPKKKS